MTYRRRAAPTAGTSGRQTRGRAAQIISSRWISWLPAIRDWCQNAIFGPCTRFAISARVLVSALIGRLLSAAATGFDERLAMLDDDEILGDDEIMVAELRIVQSLDQDGQIHVYDVSRSNDGGEIEPSKQLELLEWARASVLAPMVWGMMQAFAESDDE